MSQHVDFEEQHSYQAPSEYTGALYQGQQEHVEVSAGSPGQGFVQPGGSDVAVSRHQLILAICSLAALAASVIAFISALETDPYSGSVIVAALIGLGLVCTAIVAINVSLHLRR